MFDELINKLKNDTYITLETTPSHSPVFSPIIETIAELGLDKLVDGFTTTDNPLAKLKYNSLFAAKMLQDRFHKPVIATMSMRDRNKIALQSDLLGANEVDVRAILALTGDPATISDQPHTKGVFEADSTLLLDIISCFNSGIDYGGKPFTFKPKEIYPFAVINSYAKNPKTLQKKMQKKIKHGAIGIITQPIYDIQSAKLLLELKEATEHSSSAELIFGIFPITKLRTAQFLSAHVPGINVPNYWIEALRVANEKGVEEEYRVGFELSKKLFEDLKALHPKIHLMTANQFQIAKDILK
ncbi:MAG: 5,10-methylenetetrahydrofolate reductase [Sulfurimonas sp. RIFOXYD12_FULL_36_11]|uniref:methylenetetrahydrofolate reductase n=1 Tax=Sulfurimonas sp. RIFOXYB12_FULL_35_9 TaxID=1802256 RepID=UPI0008C66BB3|nr:methylenetetrahydrofolate reductase [Sulfurimonas sp. RIFOXYB12_FULL_35_9]MBS4068351.1 methylenetetrahydrofolate reductase [Sulfurimonas sp.]MDX9755896.1 methylenetetrahydrofolate reductase [Sulfurimonas sp.]OHE04851.1 MAG: 5,10-methylenetetrahydrofolate reductase [Sulfurimonas sp. RIFOXYB12_FULL_35_9]OHE11169.1 MAG: 5,10-methylenetetrahydrofolate reductase [Sulfurimonas sp. RIFOXYD12_FULL_36_11]